MHVIHTPDSLIQNEVITIFFFLYKTSRTSTVSNDGWLLNSFPNLTKLRYCEYEFSIGTWKVSVPLIQIASHYAVQSKTWLRHARRREVTLPFVRNHIFTQSLTAKILPQPICEAVANTLPKKGICWRRLTLNCCRPNIEFDMLVLHQFLVH